MTPMDATTVRALTDKMTKIPPCTMIATEAFHLLGDLTREVDSSCPEENLCRIIGETEDEFDDYYVGSWVTGTGFFNVLFPKVSTRSLTEEEVTKFNKMKFAINNQPSFGLNIGKP